MKFFNLSVLKAAKLLDSIWTLFLYRPLSCKKEIVNVKNDISRMSGKKITAATERKTCWVMFCGQ